MSNSEIYLVVAIENLDAEGLERLPASGPEMGGSDPGCGQDARLDDAFGDALRHFACADEP